MLQKLLKNTGVNVRHEVNEHIAMDDFRQMSEDILTFGRAYIDED